MALTDLTEDKPRKGWLRQAQRLAGAHVTPGMKTGASLAQVPQQRNATSSLVEAERASLAEAREAELAKELELALAKLPAISCN